MAALVASQDGAEKPSVHDAARKRLTDAESRLKRFQDAIAAGIDPGALVEAINEAQAQRAAARAELDGAPAPTLITDAEVFAMIDSLGDVGGDEGCGCRQPRTAVPRAEAESGTPLRTTGASSGCTARSTCG